MAYEVKITREFCAAHAIRIRGEMEPVHGHNWNVTVWVRGRALDEDGLVTDFHELERALEAVIGPWKNTDLNSISPFDRVNPTAELIAFEIAKGVRRELGIEPGAAIDVCRVQVSEAPGCFAIYEAD